MKFLLIMPKLAISSLVEYHFPLGIPYVSAAIKQAGIDVTTVNPNHNTRSIAEIVGELAPDFDAILTGGLSGQFYSIKNVIDAARQAKPSIITMVGGGVITAAPEIAMQAFGNVDIGMIGEEEKTAVELCKALEAGRTPENIPGLIWKNHKNQLIKNAVARGVIKDEIQFLLDGCPAINLSAMSEDETAVLQEEILECGSGFPPENQQLLNFNRQTGQGRVRGKCIKCGNEIVSGNLLFFCREYSLIYCPHCGVKYVPALPKELEQNFCKYIKGLTMAEKQIALWGVQAGIWKLFNENPEFKHPAITFIDTTEMRRNMKVTKAKKPILRPDIFLSRKFDSVIFCYPHLYSTYSQSAAQKYPLIDNFADILKCLA